MNTGLFVHLAEIAGVFVGFGTLIRVRSAQVTDPTHGGVIFAGYTLLALVMSQRHRPETEADGKSRRDGE